MKSTITENMPLQFLRQKIQHIRSALFFSQHNDVIEIPASIITVLRVDNEGFIWFFIKRPFQGITSFKKEFPARLDFFRKKTDYFLQITGQGFIVGKEDISINEWADVSAEIKNNVLNELVLMKVKMLNADYFDNTPSERKYWWGSFIQKIQQWFFAGKLGYKPYDFKPKHYTVGGYI